MRRDDQQTGLPALVQFSLLAAPSSRLPIPSRNCIVSAASDSSNQLVVPFGNCIVLAATDPSSQLAVPSGNCSVLSASLLGNSPDKLCNPCLLTLHATRPDTLENCTNLAIHPCCSFILKNSQSMPSLPFSSPYCSSQNLSNFTS